MTSPEPLHRRLRVLLTWVPPGAARWISLLSLGFLLAALLSHGTQVLALAPDRQGWLWLLLGVGLSLLSLIGSALLWGVVLQWLGGRPRLQPLVQAYLLSNARKYLPGGIWHLATRVQVLRQTPSGCRAHLICTGPSGVSDCWSRRCSAQRCWQCSRTPRLEL